MVEGEGGRKQRCFRGAEVGRARARSLAIRPSHRHALDSAAGRALGEGARGIGALKCMFLYEGTGRGIHATSLRYICSVE